MVENPDLPSSNAVTTAQIRQHDEALAENGKQQRVSIKTPSAGLLLVDR